MESTPIIQYWHEKDVPDYIEELFDSFREHNPDRQHMVFNEASAAAFIVDRFGPREGQAFHALADPKMQADYFRVCAVYALGGMWCDADSHCEAPLGRSIDAGGNELFKLAAPGIEAVNNAFMVFSSPNHPLPRLIVEVATVNIEERAPKFIAGPNVLSTLAASRRLGSFDALLTAKPGECERASERLLLERLGMIIGTLEHRHLAALHTIITDVRLTEAFEGVRISPAAKLDGIIAHHPWRLPYQDSAEDHPPRYK